MSNSPYVVDVSEADFQEQVVQKSRQVPVLVDFWAPWCGPCRALSPLLEELADEANGKFILAKINVDENPELAQMFNVSGIPSVFAIKDAKVLDQFSGLMQEEQLREFVQCFSPSAEAQELARVMQLATSDPAAGIVALRELHANNPSYEGYRFYLASLLIEQHEHLEEAAELLRPIESGEFAEEASRMKRILALQAIPHTEADLEAAQAQLGEEPNNPNAHMHLAETLAATGDYADALEHYFQAAVLDPELARGTIREAMVNLFHIVGIRSELADEYRDKLRTLLY